MLSGAFPPKSPADVPPVNLASDELNECFRLSLGTLHPKEEEEKAFEWTLVLPARESSADWSLVPVLEPLSSADVQEPLLFGPRAAD